MKETTKRSIVRWMHIVFSIPILGYIYSPFEKTSRLRSPNPVCLLSCNGSFRIVDVERPCPSTTYFEKIGATRCCGELLAASWPPSLEEAARYAERG
jgi:hypothetical protein